MSKIITLLVLSITISSCGIFESTLTCKGDTPSNDVIIVSDGNYVNVKYPNGLNMFKKMKIIHTSDKSFVFSTQSDTSAGLWLVNKQNLKYSYIQTKDISEFDNRGFNHHSYTGKCVVNSGNINNF